MRIEITGILSKMGVLRPSKIMYIGGSDVLPPPLKGADEQRMLELLSGWWYTLPAASRTRGSIWRI